MNVRMLIHDLGVGGSESMVARLATHLRAAGDFVEIDCLGALGLLGEELLSDGFSVTVHQRREGIDSSLPVRLARRVRRQRCDVVHVHQRTALFYGVLAGLLHATPLVYTEHGPFDGTPRKRQRAFNRLLRWRIAAITTVSENLKQSLVSREGFSARSIEVVPNAIDTERFACRSPGARERARDALSLPAAAPVLGTVGRLVEVKNHALLLHVLAHLASSMPEALLVLVGDGAKREELELLARQLGVSARVRFLGVRRDVERILPAFDLFLMSSLAEGIPVSMLEAMAARLPIVTTNVGGVREAVRDDLEAVVLADQPPACGRGQTLSPAAYDYIGRFADAVASLLREPERARRLTDAAFRRVSADFSASVMCARYEQILRRAARARRV